MKYPARANAKISLETKNQFEKIQKEEKKKGVKITYRTAIEFFVYCHDNPYSINGLKLKKFLQEDKIKELKNDLACLNLELKREEEEYNTIMEILTVQEKTFDINSYNEKNIDIAKNYLKENKITDINNIDDSKFELKLKTTGLTKKEFKKLLIYLLEENKEDFKNKEEDTQNSFPIIKEKLSKNNNKNLSKEAIDLISRDISKYLNNKTKESIEEYSSNLQMISKRSKKIGYSETKYKELIIECYNIFIKEEMNNE